MKKMVFLICSLVCMSFFNSCKEKNVVEANDPPPPGLNQLIWNDSESNPIMTFYHNNSTYGPYYGRVLFDQGKFKMWFANSFGNDKYDIGYAESDDGISWRIVKKHALEAGPVGNWDSYCVHPGAVIKEGNFYKMYYCGQSRPNDASDKRIGLATSTDGINWTRSSIETVNQININGYTTDIVKSGDKYYLYYGNSDVIGVATSTDGLNWNKSGQSIILASYNWEGSRVWSCSVIKDGDLFKMVYTTKLMNSFGYAESVDGLMWTKKELPIFTTFNLKGGDASDVRYPFLRKVNRTYYLFYSTVSIYYDCTLRVAKASY